MGKARNGSYRLLRTLDNRVLDDLVDPGDSDEYFLIDSFVSRITPLILAAKVVADLKSKSMDDANQETDMETILNEFADQATEKCVPKCGHG